MGVSSYRELKVWQVGMELVEKVYKFSSHFPKHELYGLTSQMQRSAISIPSNIAEGQARDSTKEFLHFLSITLGSLAELETQIILAERLSYLETQESTVAIHQIHELAKMLRSLQKSLKKRLE